MTVEDISTSGDRDTLRRVLRYPMFILKLCGAYVEFGKPRRFGCRSIAHLTFCIIINIFTWCENMRYLVAMFLETQPARQLSIGIFLIYYMVNSFYLSLCLRVLTTKMPDIYDKFRTYQQHHRLGLPVLRWERNLRFLIIFLIVYYIAGGVASVLVYNLGVLSEDSILHKLLFPFSSLQNGRFVWIGTFFVVVKSGVLTSLFHNFFYLLFYLISLILKLEYRRVNKDLKRFLCSDIYAEEKKSDADDRNSIEDFRRHHAAITDLVIAGNDVMKHLAGMQYGVSVPVLCTFLYGILYGKLAIEDSIILSSYSMFYFLSMVHLTFTAAALNQEAQSSYHVLTSVDTRELPMRTLLQLQMFLSRLKGPSIGVNFYGLFTIDSTTILMLFGTLLTYGIIVLQMAPYHSTSSVICTCPVHNISNIMS